MGGSVKRFASGASAWATGPSLEHYQGCSFTVGGDSND
jgi:hypothetical protein